MEAKFEELEYRRRVFDGLKELKRTIGHVLDQTESLQLSMAIKMVAGDIMELSDELDRQRICTDCGSDLRCEQELDTGATVWNCPVCGIKE